MEPVKCVVLGDGLVGKTSLLITYITGSFPSEWRPTSIDCHTSALLVDGKAYALHLWDLAGGVS